MKIAFDADVLARVTAPGYHMYITTPARLSPAPGANLPQYQWLEKQT